MYDDDDIVFSIVHAPAEDKSDDTKGCIYVELVHEFINFLSTT
jgi:hypothetical protein